MNRDFVDLLRALRDADVRFLIVGGYALALRSSTRDRTISTSGVKATADNAPRVVRALANFGAPLQDVSEQDFGRPGVVFQVGVPPGRIDLLTELTALTFDEAWRTREQGRFGEIVADFIGRDAFIRNKRATGRAKDLLDIEGSENDRASITRRPRRRLAPALDAPLLRARARARGQAQGCGDRYRATRIGRKDDERGRLNLMTPDGLQAAILRDRRNTMSCRRVARVLTLVIASCVLAACASHGTVISTGDNQNVGGTISGIVRSASGDVPLAGRKVTIVNVESGETLETSTATNGGYTIKVPRGHYRLDVELRAGEALSSKPDDVHITASDLDAGRNFVITVKAPPAA